MQTDRAPRDRFTAADIIHRFAAQGVAVDVMSRALCVERDQVRGVCERARESGLLAGVVPETNETAADRKLALRMEVVNLRQWLADATALIKELQSPVSDTGAAFAYDRLVHLTLQEMRILTGLVTHGRMSKDRLYNELYGNRLGEGPEPKIIDVFVCKLRAKLRPHGVEIETRWGHGYEMRPEMVARLNALAGVTGRVPHVESPSLQATLEEMVA
jgi:hypothetical protein